MYLTTNLQRVFHDRKKMVIEMISEIQKYGGRRKLISSEELPYLIVASGNLLQKENVLHVEVHLLA